MRNIRAAHVLMIANKELADKEHEVRRPFHESIMYTTELPALSKALLWSKSNTPWRPRIWILDLQNTCDEIKPIIVARLGLGVCFSCGNSLKISKESKLWDDGELSLQAECDPRD